MTNRTYDQIKESERHAIALGLQQKQSIRAIARALGRSPSTISREIHRNAGGHGYASKYAQQRSDRRRRFARPQPKLHSQGPLLPVVCNYLRRRWSPQQIAEELRRLHPLNRRMQASHESIYTCLYAQPRGELKKELVSCLRLTRAARWPRSKGKDRRGEIKDLVSIHVRPPEIEDRQLPGHWEGDLIKGKANASAIGTLVERTTQAMGSTGDGVRSCSSVLSGYQTRMFRITDRNSLLVNCRAVDTALQDLTPLRGTPASSKNLALLLSRTIAVTSRGATPRSSSLVTAKRPSLPVAAVMA